MARRCLVISETVNQGANESHYPNPTRNLWGSDLESDPSFSRLPIEVPDLDLEMHPILPVNQILDLLNSEGFAVLSYKEIG